MSKTTLELKPIEVVKEEGPDLSPNRMEDSCLVLQDEERHIAFLFDDRCGRFYADLFAAAPRMLYLLEEVVKPAQNGGEVLMVADEIERLVQKFRDRTKTPTDWVFDLGKYEGAVELGRGEKPTTPQGITATLDLYNDAPRILQHTIKLTQEVERLRRIMGRFATPEELRRLAPEVMATSTVPPGMHLDDSEGGEA